MPLAPRDVLAPVLPPLGAPPLGGLDRLPGEARDAGGGLTPRCDARAFAHGRAPRGPGPGSAPWRHVVRDRARGQEILRPQVPWTPAPVPRAKRGEDGPACRPDAGARRVDPTWQVASTVPREPLGHPGEPRDISGEL